MIIAATGDIHSPISYDLFIKSMDNIRNSPELFLIAGDLVDRKSTRDQGPFNELRKISNAFFGKIDCPVISCFGNNEFEQDWEEIKKQCSGIKFLHNESIIIDVKGKKVGIVGSKGSLDRPTWWQKKYMPEMAEKYKKTIETINNLFMEMDADYKILLVHYPPTYKILTGEDPQSYAELASSELEKVIIDQKLDLVLTGHAHRGKKEVWVDGIPVINVGLSLNNGILILDTDKLKPGLGKFF